MQRQKPETQTPCGNTGSSVRGVGGSGSELSGQNPSSHRAKKLPVGLGLPAHDLMWTFPDWLQFVVPFTDVQWSESVSRLPSLIADMTNDKLGEISPKGLYKGQKYKFCQRSVCGAIFAWNPPKTVQRQGKKVVLSGSILVSLNGRVVNQLSIRDYYFLLKYLKTLGARHTRSDIRIDDYVKSIDPRKLTEALSDGDYTGFKKHQIILGRSRSPETNEIISEGFTFYFGSRSSESFSYLYDKSAESNGRVDSYRFERRLKDSMAQNFVDGFLAELDPAAPDFEYRAARHLAQVAIGQLDFIDRGGRGNHQKACRSERLDWWADFVDALGGQVEIKPTRPPSTFEKKINWLFKSCAKSWAIALESFGDSFLDFLRDALFSGEARFDSQDLAMVAFAKSQYPRGYDPNLFGKIDDVCVPSRERDQRSIREDRDQELIGWEYKLKFSQAFLRNLCLGYGIGDYIKRFPTWGHLSQALEIVAEFDVISPDLWDQIWELIGFLSQKPEYQLE